MDEASTDEDRGIYGLRVAGLPGAAHLLRPADPRWPLLRVTRQLGGRLLTADEVDEDVASYRLEPAGGDVWLDRAAGTAHFAMTEDHDDQAYVHPFLAMVGAVFARWWDRDAFHAGAFVHEGRAWGVLGEREAGKSSLMAQLHLDGVPVVADDVVVVADGLALPGPGCIDLRPGAAEHLQVGEHIGTIGRRPRYRLAVDPVAGPVPLAGWILPTWGEPCTVTRVPATAHLPLLMRNLALSRVPRAPERLMDLAALPFLVWQRPRDWAQMGPSVRVLLDATA